MLGLPAPYRTPGQYCLTVIIYYLLVLYLLLKLFHIYLY